MRTNEATDACEIVTNEATDASQRERKVLQRSRIKIKSTIRSKDRRPTVDHENPTKEATDTREIVTIGPDTREIVTNEATLAADVGQESPTYM